MTQLLCFIALPYYSSRNDYCMSPALSIQLMSPESGRWRHYFLPRFLDSTGPSYVDFSAVGNLQGPSPSTKQFVMLCGGTPSNKDTPTNTCVSVERISNNR